MVTFKIDKPFTGKYLDNIEAERNKKKIIKLKKRNAVTFNKGKKNLQWKSLFNHQERKKSRSVELTNLPVLLMMHLFTNDASYLKIRQFQNMHVRKCNPSNLYQYITF